MPCIFESGIDLVHLEDGLFTVSQLTNINDEYVLQH